MIIIVTAVALAVFGWIILALVDGIFTKRGPDYGVAPAMVRWCVANRFVVSAALIPSMLCGVHLLRRCSSRTAVWVVLGMVLLLPSLAVVLYCFYHAIAPLLEYRPLS